MATYIPNATQTTEPVESRTVESAALEFRTLKTSINARIEDVQDGLDTEIVNRIAGDANLQTQNNAQDVRLQAIEAALLIIGEGGLPGTVYVQRLSGTGAQTSFTLDVSVPSSALIDVFINGIYQNKNTFTIVDDVLTFSEAPPVGTDNVEVVVSITIANVETDASLVSFRATDSTVVVRTAQDKMREWISVKDFGAVGDGVADDTGAVQSAINVAGQLRKPLYIPSGIYRITEPLNLRIATASNADTLTLEGDGDLNSHIWLDSNAAAGVFTYDNGWTAANVAGCSTTSGSGVVTTTGTFAGVAVAGGALAIAGLPVCNIVSVDSPTQITVDRTASATASGLTARVYNTVATAKNRLRLRNLYLTHSQAVTNKTSWHSGTAMRFNGVVNSEFENIRINGFTRGVDMLGGWINNFKKVMTSGCREGFYIELCTYLWVFERCATVNSGGAGNWAGMKLINGGGISLLSHIIEQDNIGLELQGVRGYSIHGGNIESVSYEYSVILKGLPWATTDERHWTQAGDIAGIRIYDSQGILMSNGVKGIRIRANAFELSNPAFAPNGQSWIRTTGESNLVKNVDESGNIFPAGYESITHILAPTGFPTLAMCQSITRDGMRYSSGAPYYGKYWQKGDRLFRLPGDVTAGSYDGWVCTAASSGADGSATWKQFGTVQA